MTRIGNLRSWLLAPSLKGVWAYIGVAVAVAVPTLIRELLDDLVTGTEYAPYFPSVLLAAIFLGWGYAALVALISTIVVDALFIGPPPLLLEGPSDLFGVAVFVTGSALIIGFVHAIRSVIASHPAAVRAEETPGGIVFSLEDGQAWASWYGQDSPVRLGPQEEVEEMMEDFLAQLELGRHLSGKIRHTVS